KTPRKGTHFFVRCNKILFAATKFKTTINRLNSKLAGFCFSYFCFSISYKYFSPFFQNLPPLKNCHLHGCGTFIFVLFRFFVVPPAFCYDPNQRQIAYQMYPHQRRQDRKRFFAFG
ncbi:MAG: hypothetical protein LBB79_08065, partial [Prevotellaceae bacterium]|nr:hypothetical protein [Prevotellaceae bacterium]